MIIRDELIEWLDYDPETGVFTWRKDVRSGIYGNGRAVRAGQVAGSQDAGGYRVIRVCGHVCKAHRLAWLYVYGVWPDMWLDHINNDRQDNRIANLRQATEAGNAHNASVRKDNVSGFKGVTWHKASQRWVAQIGNGRGKRKHLGCYKTPEEAHAAYADAAVKHFGKFARTS